MKTKQPLLPEQCLSQLASQYQCNPLSLNLNKVIKDLFAENPPKEFISAIDHFCIAALTEGYAWRQGSPANALHWCRNIKLLIEIAWLLHQKTGKTKTANKLPENCGCQRHYYPCL